MKRRYDRLPMAGLVVLVLAVTLTLLAAGGEGALAGGGIIYVDANAGGANNGSSWRNAYTDLQDALDEAGIGDQIWVASGIYRPTPGPFPSNPRAASFQMVNGVAIYGGFDPDAGAVKLSDRDWLAHETVLSCDFGIEGDASDNCYHVFYHPEDANLDSTAILDGFTISGGNADGDWSHMYGGGMYNNSSSPALTNVTFVGNYAASGGGGIYNDNSSSPVLTNCTFSGNSAGSGGGMYNNHGSSPALTNCTFAGNSATDGGGMINVYDSSPVLADCTFQANSARWGGGMGNYGGSPVLTNCTFSGNSASADGGGMSNHLSSPTLTNCTFWGNSAAYYGGGMSNYSSSPALTNCILWDNSPDQISNDNSRPAVTYSDIELGFPGVGNISADPLLVDAAGGDYHLQPGSPCIDAGHNGAPNLPLYDFEGDDRILDGNGDGTATVDMGVDEFKLPPIQVEIDIAPGTPANVIKLSSARRVPVAILTTAEFDAADVDPATVWFAGARAVLQSTSMKDVDDDGDLDLLLYFKTKDLNLDQHSTEATLTGETYDGDLIEGTDTVKVIP